MAWKRIWNKTDLAVDSCFMLILLLKWFPFVDIRFCALLCYVLEFLHGWVCMTRPYDWLVHIFVTWYYGSPRGSARYSLQTTLRNSLRLKLTTASFPRLHTMISKKQKLPSIAPVFLSSFIFFHFFSNVEASQPFSLRSLIIYPTWNPAFGSSVNVEHL